MFSLNIFPAIACQISDKTFPFVSIILHHGFLGGQQKQKQKFHKYLSNPFLKIKSYNNHPI